MINLPQFFFFLSFFLLISLDPSSVLAKFRCTHSSRRPGVKYKRDGGKKNTPQQNKVWRRRGSHVKLTAVKDSPAAQRQVDPQQHFGLMLKEPSQFNSIISHF